VRGRMLKSSAMPNDQKYETWNELAAQARDLVQVALCRLLVRAPIFPGGGILIRVLAATYPRKPHNQPQAVEDEHQDHKRHESKAAINYASRH